ncbi:hypothetical protein BC833DRAFT_644839 [Globomyces pollinis-pini]|nr:hypothetical protein BC833DRAFT_644839 [Globomyces pollinis-pini]
MSSIHKHLGRYQFLSPVIETTAIQKLNQHLTNYFNTEPGVAEKPTCVICFDMSGSGKTTTIMEAARKSASLFTHFSLIDNVLFRPLFNYCKSTGQKQNRRPLEPDEFISYDQTVLIQLFHSIFEQLDNLDSSKLINGTNIRGLSLTDINRNLIYKVRNLKHLLVIHLDDCQEFFCGMTSNAEKQQDDKFKVGDIMGFALRLNAKEILGVFSGTIPTLSLEIKMAGKFRQYFDLHNMADELKKKMDHLTGPPKLLYWFILSTAEQIQGTINSFGLSPERLERYSYNLGLLHTHFLSFDLLPPKWLPFIEAGMNRIRKEGTFWKLFPPNRFLVKIFNRYIKWFNWENVSDLLANITASSTAKTQVLNPSSDKSKTDVIFFADSIQTYTTVRVLCQLTTQVKDSTAKSYSTSLLCDPSKTTVALAELMNFSVSLDDKQLANQIGMFVPGTSTSKKRKRQHIDVMELSTLTDAKLEKDKILQGGLREAVLSVIEDID